MTVKINLKYFLFNTKELAYSGKEHFFLKNNMIEFGSTVLKTARLKRVSGGIYEKLASSNCRKWKLNLRIKHPREFRRNGSLKENNMLYTGLELHADQSL